MKVTKKIVSLSLALLLAMSSITSAWACTGIYVGSESSANGSTYMGRSEDIGNLYGKQFGVAPAQDWPEGAVYKDTYGFQMPYPAHTYAYTYVKDAPEYGETMTDESGNPVGEAYGEAGQNEMGVSISATVSTYYNQDAKAADPLTDNGICEISLLSVLLGGASTAKEAVDLLASILDEYGSGECNSLMIADSQETWYFEIVSGHQYAAIKLPADKVSVQPNITLLGVIDVEDTANVVASPALVTLAKDNGFLETDENGCIDVAKTYAAEDSGKGQYSRYWQGLFYVNEEAANALDVTQINNGVNPLPLLVDTDHQLTTLEVLHWLAYRGEGTKMDSNADPSIYPIGNPYQAECHVFETRQGLPAQLATIQWLAMADAEFSVYVPFYSALLTETLANYQTPGAKAVENSINWNFQVINDLCNKNRTTCAPGVKAYFETYQQSLIDQQTVVDQTMLALYAADPALAAQKATELGLSLSQQVLDMTNALVDELETYLAGDMAQPFVPTAADDGLLPDYSLAAIGGDGLDTPDPDENTEPEIPDDSDDADTPDDDQPEDNEPADQPDTDATDDVDDADDVDADAPAQDSGEEKPSSPATGDDGLGSGMLLALTSLGGLALVWKKKLLW